MKTPTLADAQRERYSQAALLRCANLEAALRKCIDSLEYVEQAHPGISGWVVRRERIKKAKELLS